MAFVYAGMAFVLALTGPGTASLDHAAGLDVHHGVGWAIVVLAVGLAATVPPLLTRRRNLAADGSSEHGG